MTRESPTPAASAVLEAIGFHFAPDSTAQIRALMPRILDYPQNKDGTAPKKAESLDGGFDVSGLRSDGWARFECAVDAAVKSGPKHRPTQKQKERAASKGRVHKGKTGD